MSDEEINLSAAKHGHDNSYRIEQFIYIALSGQSGQEAQCFKDFLEDESPEDICEVFGDVPRAVMESDDLAESLADWLRETNRHGFLVQFATPVMQVLGSDFRQFSWGYYKLRWLYSDTLPGVIDAGRAWVKSVRDEEAEAAKA